MEGPAAALSPSGGCMGDALGVAALAWPGLPEGVPAAVLVRPAGSSRFGPPRPQQLVPLLDVMSRCLVAGVELKGGKDQETGPGARAVGPSPEHLEAALRGCSPSGAREGKEAQRALRQIKGLLQARHAGLGGLDGVTSAVEAGWAGVLRVAVAPT